MIVERWVLWFLLLTSFLSICLAAASVGVCWRLAFRVGRALKRKSPSESTLLRLEADQTALSSSLETVMRTVKRMAGRHAVQDFRARADDGPPPGTSKAELRRHFGLIGKSPQEIAAMALKKTDAAER